MKKNWIFIVLGLFLISGIFITDIGYSLFNSEHLISGEAHVRVDADIRVTNVEVLEMNENAYPTYKPEYSKERSSTFTTILTSGEVITYQVTIENKSDKKYELIDIIEELNTNANVSYEIIGLEINEIIEANTTKIFTIKQTTNVDNQKSDLTLKYEFEEYSPLNLKQKILADNSVYPDNVSSPYVSSESGIDFSKISSDTNGKGLYYTTNLTLTEDINGDGNGEVVYYFRGDVKNNYLIFANLCWRIVRINESGSVRLRYDGIPKTEGGILTCPQTGEVTGGTIQFNTNSDDVAYVGYMYPTTPTTLATALDKLEDNDIINANESAIKHGIDYWYEENLLNHSEKIADEIFCVDRTVAEGSVYNGTTNTKNAYGKNNVHFGAFGRLVAESSGNVWAPRNDSKPQYKCERYVDSFTTLTTNGNGKLKYPLGYLTMDEVVYAGGVWYNTDGTSSNNSYYLYTSTRSWTITPADFMDNNAAFAITINADGSIGHRVVNLSDAYSHPVISLKENLIVATGTGLYNDPYTLE